MKEKVKPEAGPDKLKAQMKAASLKINDLSGTPPNRHLPKKMLLSEGPFQMSDKVSIFEKEVQSIDRRKHNKNIE